MVKMARRQQMSTMERVPTRVQILASRGLVISLGRLGRSIPPDVIRDAEWPLEEAAPYPEKESPPCAGCVRESSS
jgi:hypothetical protein